MPQATRKTSTASAAQLLWVPDRGDVIWIDFSPQVGAEMKNEHPMVVLSNKAFNARTKIVIGLPLTHAQSNEMNPFAEKFIGPHGEACYVLCHLPKSFDWRERNARPHPIKTLSPAIFKVACEALNQIVMIAD